MNYAESRFGQAWKWEEDDFDLPPGAVRLGHSEPQSCRTYIMYHGTSREAAQGIVTNGFRQSPGGMLGPGVYLSRDLEKASRYPLNLAEHQKVVLRVTVNVGKVIKIDRQGHRWQKSWHDWGYDTAWVPPDCGMVKSGLEENCVWDPDRIRVLDIIEPKVLPPSPPRIQTNQDGYMPLILTTLLLAGATLFAMIQPT